MGVAADVVAQDDRFCDFFHRTALLAALTLDGQVRLLFVQPEIALQDSFRAFNHLARLQLLGERRVHFLEARKFDFRSDQESDGGDDANFAAAVDVVMAMLQVQHTDHASSAHQRNGEKRFVTVFWKFVKKLKPGIVRGSFGDCNRFAMLGDPSRNSLPYAELQAIDYFRMRVFGCAKDQFVAFEHVDKAGITLYKGSGKFNNASKNLMKAIGGVQADGDFMKDINMRVFYRY